ncbi:MAG: hypothetical protein R2709_04210 [Marmoricola sp.]
MMPILVMLRERKGMWHLMEDLEALVTSGAQAAEVTAACKTPRAAGATQSQGRADHLSPGS